MKHTLITLILLLSASCAPKKVTTQPGNYMIKYGACLCEVDETRPYGQREISIYCIGEKIKGTAILSTISDKPIDALIHHYKTYCK